MELTKTELRKDLRQRRRGLSQVEQDVAAHSLLQQLMPLLVTAKNIAVYHACNGEINLALVADYLIRAGKSVYQPIAYYESRQLRFEKYTKLAAAMFYSADYQAVNEIASSELDLILLPLVAIDAHGYRLGQGGGYYDTTFAHLANVASSTPSPTENSLAKQTLLCGVGYDWQLIAKVPHAEWDLKMNYFGSESQLRCF